jgi:DNA/RNA endonuclease YhcR with UshA esterase domain
MGIRPFFAILGLFLCAIVARADKPIAGSAIASDQRLTMIQGKTISITGVVRLRDGKPEIEVLSADQIKGLDSQTER